ncbi:MAG: hypothetical protein Kow0067_05280 [Coriobacteriia bacterium]
MFRRLHGDDGFTLSELTVVLALLSIILGVAWLGYRATNAGVQVSDRQAAVSREIGQPLEQMERVLSQQYRIADSPAPSDYTMRVSTDMDRDGQTEHTTFQATADGTLLMKRYEGDTNAADEVTFVLSEHNANQAAAVPLFQYYRSDGVELSPGSGYVSSDTFKVRITVVVEYDGRQFTDSRFVYFRN